MQDFFLYLKLGWEHIVSLDALDHQLFVLALVVAFGISEWQKILVLITAFTIGHSITLAISVLDIIRIRSEWVEFLIPLTIVITAADNILKQRNSGGLLKFNYILALFFGLIHGMGFANTARMAIAKEQSIAMPLLGFNIGLELGQVLVVVIILIFTYFFINILKINKKSWILGISLLVLIFAAKMCIERFPNFS